MREPRPHRPARTDEDAAAQLQAEVSAGRFDADAVDAVLRAAGHRVARRNDGPAGLTQREVEVLRLVARGLTNKQIATELTISSKTVANHVERIYAKIGASSRARAGLFAMQHGPLPEEQFAGSVPAEKMSQTPHAIPPRAIYGQPHEKSTANAREESR
jgi:DNA-binding CsgD family transcriptional regulator